MASSVQIGHENNIISIANRIIDNVGKNKFDFPEEGSDFHISKKYLIDGIKKYFLSYLQRYVQNPDYLISIRWFYTQKLLDFNPIDPILPYNKDDNESLYYELEKINVPHREIEELSRDIFTMIKNYNPRHINVDIPVLLSEQNGTITVSYNKIRYDMTQEVYSNLKNLYTNNSKKYGNQNEVDVFNRRLFNLFCRYESLAAPGYHAAIPEKMCDLIRNNLFVTHQLFASPFNCNPKMTYTSAYPDTDKFFGSLGNFFEKYEELFTSGGSFEANPPFLEEYLAVLSKIIEKALLNEKPLSFFVVYPGWDDAIGYRLLLESKWNVLGTKVINFERNRHTYMQTSQYLIKKIPPKPSNSRSSIFILQNEAGKNKYKVSAPLLNEIIKSFQ